MVLNTYYHKVNHQISLSLVKPKHYFLLLPEKGADGLDLANPTVPVLEAPA